MQMNIGNLTVYNGLRKSFGYVISREGVKRLWRGISSVFLGAGPAHAIYFMVYEEAKLILIQQDGRKNQASGGYIHFATSRKSFSLADTHE